MKTKMKTRRFTLLIAHCSLFIVTCSLLIAFTACDNGNGKNDPPTFTVTFHANGGTPEPPPQTIAQGGKAAEPQVTKPNNTLDGWYTQAAFTAQWNFAADTVTADIDLYAKWTELAFEPAVRDFQIENLDFLNPDVPTMRYNIAVRDARTNCGAATLEDLDIIDELGTAIMGAFNYGNGPTKNRFRAVFGRDITIIVDNPATPYKAKATDIRTIYFHIDYLQSNPNDFFQKIIDMITAMNTGSTALPHEVE